MNALSSFLALLMVCRGGFEQAQQSCSRLGATAADANLLSSADLISVAMEIADEPMTLWLASEAVGMECHRITQCSYD